MRTPSTSTGSSRSVEDRDEREALRRGLEGGNFFGYSLAYYIVFGDPTEVR